MKKIIRFACFLPQFMEDFFIFAGLTIIIWTTYTINPVFGHYLLGGSLLIIGLLMARR